MPADVRLRISNALLHGILNPSIILAHKVFRLAPGRFLDRDVFQRGISRTSGPVRQVTNRECLVSFQDMIDTIERVIYRPERYQLPALILFAGVMGIFFRVPFLSDRPFLGGVAVILVAVLAWKAHPLFASASILRAHHYPQSDQIVLALDGESLSFVRSEAKYIVTKYNSDYANEMYVVFRNGTYLQMPEEPHEGHDLLVQAAKRWGIRHIWTNYLHEVLEQAPPGREVI